MPEPVDLGGEQTDLALHVRHLFLGPRRRLRTRGGKRLRLEHLDLPSGAREGLFSSPCHTASLHPALLGRFDRSRSLSSGRGRTARSARQLRLKGGDLPLPRLDLPPLRGVAQQQLVELGLERLTPFGLDLELGL